MVQLNVRGRDLGSFVAAAQQAIRAKLKLPSGYITVGWAVRKPPAREPASHDSRPPGALPDFCVALHEL